MTVDEYHDRTVADIVVSEVDRVHGADGNWQVGLSPREQADPSFVLVTGYLHADRSGRPAGLPGVTETVEPGGDDEDERSLRRSQHLFDAGRVEQAEGGV
jgi:hypothetical protein